MDPTYEIIKKCIEILKANTVVSSFVGNRIYDRVPEKQDGTPNVPFPYISLGNTNLITDDYECIDAVTISLQFHCWSSGDSEAYSSVEVRKLAFAVRKCLKDIDIELDENGFVSLTHQLIAYNRSANGTVWQASVSFETLIDIP